MNDAESMDAMAASCVVLISAAGPYTLLGEAAARARRAFRRGGASSARVEA